MTDRNIIGGGVTKVTGTVDLAAGNNNVGDVDVRFIDENGVPYGIKHVGNKPRVSSTPYFVDIAEGNVPGHTAVNKFGHNSGVGATLEPVWDYSGPYTYLADDTFAAFYISSDSAADQSQIYQATGIDSDYNYSTVNVTTDAADGRAFVALTSGAADNQWWRVFRVKHIPPAVPAIGNIYISNDNTDVGGNGIPDNVANIQAQILIGLEQTQMAIWTCPVDNTAYITKIWASTSSDKVTEVHFAVRPFGGVFQVKHIVSMAKGVGLYEYDFPELVAAKSDIRVSASATGGGGNVSARVDLWFEEN